MLLPAKIGLGGPIGSGRQWWSWIALDDVVGIYKHLALDSTLAGPVNATAPEPVRQKEFAKELGRILKRPSFVPLPKFAIKAALGEMGESLLFDSARVLPERLSTDRYEFKYRTFPPALRDLIT
jgi:uncharacterized protein (TIGR01777 family)